MIQFYAPDIEVSQELPEAESNHCIRVLRLSAGDIITVTDGKGNRFDCRITVPHPKHTKVEIIAMRKVPNHWGANIAVAIAPTKNADRLEWFVEKAVEMGIDEIIPLKCNHSERKNMKTDRLRKIAVSAMNQSLKSTLPQIRELTDFKEFVSEENREGDKFIAWCDKDSPRKIFSDTFTPHNPITIMIGPEGDFSPGEVDIAIESGYIPVSFGESRLRTETAGVFAVASVHAINMKNK